jgi:uncharacterized protein YjbI with pentapeptide repeats
MRIRPGFARLLPLIAIAALAGGTVALLACERPNLRPPQPITGVVAAPYDGGCSDVPAHRFVDRAGHQWELADLRGREIKGMTIVGLGWFGAVLRGETFTACDFCNADLRDADLSNSCLWGCDFTGADLTDADLSGVTYDIFIRWPAGFEPQMHGARLDH